jgi:uncharacterized coiled-coil protein SlyX
MIEWLLSHFTSSIFIWITYIMFAGGFVLYIASKLVKWLPQIRMYKLPIEIAGVILLIAGAYLLGRYDTEIIWKERVKEAEQRVAISEQIAKEANKKLADEVKKKQKTVTKVRTVIKEVIKEKEKIINAECKIIPEVNIIHNDAALNRLPVEKK